MPWESDISSSRFHILFFTHKQSKAKQNKKTTIKTRTGESALLLKCHFSGTWTWIQSPESQVNWHGFTIPVLGRERQEALWGSLSGQPSLLSEFQTSERSVLRRRIKDGWYRRNDLHTHIHYTLHAQARHTPKPKKQNSWPWIHTYFYLFCLTMYPWQA